MNFSNFLEGVVSLNHEYMVFELSPPSNIKEGMENYNSSESLDIFELFPPSNIKEGGENHNSHKPHLVCSPNEGVVLK